MKTGTDLDAPSTGIDLQQEVAEGIAFRPVRLGGTAYPAIRLAKPPAVEQWLSELRMARSMANLEKLAGMLDCCTMCPRLCAVNRNAGQAGYCGIAARARVASAGPHFGEEPVLTGTGGSGTIFFAGCNLHCIYCQNYDISRNLQGVDVGTERLAEMMLRLAADGAVNISLVSPSHLAAQIAPALVIARDNGMTLPVIYNTGGYDSIETLKALEGLIDVYMPDMKYADPVVSTDLSDAPDYPQINQAAVREMHRQVGDLTIRNGLATGGLLVRHLVLPNRLSQCEQIMDFLADEISVHTAVNVMAQYRPCYQAVRCPPIMRRPTSKEVAEAVSCAKKRGLRLL